MKKTYYKKGRSMVVNDSAEARRVLLKDGWTDEKPVKPKKSKKK